MLSPQDREAVREAVLFASLPRELSERLMAQSIVRRAARGETLFLQDDPAEAVFVMLEGWVKLYRMTPTGAEAVVGVFTRGRSFGEAAAFQGDVYPVSAAAVTDARVLVVRAGAILALMDQNPALCRAMVASTFRHLHALVAQIEQLKAQSGAQRVAEFLASLAPVGEGACAVTLPYDKALIAGRLGMKPESLSRAFARLREVGVTVTNNRAAIADVAALREFVEEDRAAAWSREA
jgi:CRP-like cAMP-binding protein